MSEPSLQIPCKQLAIAPPLVPNFFGWQGPRSAGCGSEDNSADDQGPPSHGIHLAVHAGVEEAFERLLQVNRGQRENKELSVGGA